MTRWRSLGRSGKWAARRRVWVIVWVFGTVATATPAALANIVITLEASDAEGNPINDTLPARSVVSVDIFLAVDAEDDPLTNLRTVQFDFDDTSSALVLRDFHWVFPPEVEAGSYTEIESLPRPRISYAADSRVGNSIIDLGPTPVLVATIEVTVNRSGTLDLRNVGADQADHGLFARAGFPDPIEFSLADSNPHKVSGGTLRLTVEGDDGVDTDGDGVPDNADRDDDGDGVNDNQDAFPLDSAETLDTDDDGTGNNADTDDDNDGILDGADACPLDASETRDSDGDGLCDNADPDSPDDRNAGPRVNGRLCGGSVVTVLPLMMLGWTRWRRNSRPKSVVGDMAANHYHRLGQRRRMGVS